MCRQSNYRLDVRASTQKCKRMLYIYFFISFLLLLLPFCVVSFKDNRTRCIGECCGGQLLLPPSLSPAVSLPDCSCRSPSAPVFLLPTRLAPRPPWRHHIREKQRPAEKPPLLLHIHTQTWTNKTSVCAHGAKSAQVSWLEQQQQQLWINTNGALLLYRAVASPSPSKWPPSESSHKWDAKPVEMYAANHIQVVLVVHVVYQIPWKRKEKKNSFFFLYTLRGYDPFVFREDLVDAPLPCHASSSQKKQKTKKNTRWIALGAWANLRDQVR